MLKRFDPARPRAVLAAAVLFGVLGGLAASVLMTFTAEPVIGQAIALEEIHQADSLHRAGEAAEPEIVSRETQKGVGRFAAYGLGGAGYGVVFGIAFLALGPRRRDVFRRALLAGALLAGAFTVMPFAKYPPNPPAVGDPASLTERQWKYLALIFLSLVVLSAGVALSARLRERGWPDDERLIAVALAVVVSLGVVCALLPPFPDAINVPATLVWRFRIASLSGNLLLWGALTVGFATLAARRERELSVAQPVPASPPSGLAASR